MSAYKYDVSMEFFISTSPGDLATRCSRFKSCRDAKSSDCHSISIRLASCMIFIHSIE